MNRTLRVHTDGHTKPVIVQRQILELRTVITGRTLTRSFQQQLAATTKFIDASLNHRETIFGYGDFIYHAFDSRFARARR